MIYLSLVTYPQNPFPPSSENAGGSSYSLPVASAETLGGVKVGSNLSINESGVLSAPAPYSLPVASAETLGGVKVGSNLSINESGVLSAPAPYYLPVASGETLGGVKVGSNLSIDENGVLSASATGLTFKQKRYTGNGETTNAIDFGNDTPKFIYNIIPDPDETFLLNNYEFINGFAWGMPFAFNYWCSQSGGVPTSYGGTNVPHISYNGNVATIIASSATIACNYNNQEYLINYVV